MKTLSQVKDEVAKRRDFSNWDALVMFYDGVAEYISDEVSIEYASQLIDDHLQRAADNAKVENTNVYVIGIGWETKSRIDKASIINTEKILL